jgi:hypothetical protein
MFSIPADAGTERPARNSRTSGRKRNVMAKTFANGRKRLELRFRALQGD